MTLYIDTRPIGYATSLDSSAISYRMMLSAGTFFQSCTSTRMKRHLRLVSSSKFYSKILLKHLVCPNYRKGSRTKSCVLAMKGSSQQTTRGILVSLSTTSRVLAWVHLLNRCASTSRIYPNQHHHLWLRLKMMFRTRRASQATQAIQVILPTALAVVHGPGHEHRLDELEATANPSHDRGLDHYQELHLVGPLLDEDPPPDLSLRHQGVPLLEVGHGRHPCLGRHLERGEQDHTALRFHGHHRVDAPEATADLFLGQDHHLHAGLPQEKNGCEHGLHQQGGGGGTQARTRVEAHHREDGVVPVMTTAGTRGRAGLRPRTFFESWHDVLIGRIVYHSVLIIHKPRFKHKVSSPLLYAIVLSRRSMQVSQ